ncbi:MAG: hypothetical protein LBD37_04755 [Treponema sp.]|nr:hypothetical protein [Treponema sp.]
MISARSPQPRLDSDQRPAISASLEPGRFQPIKGGTAAFPFAALRAGGRKTAGAWDKTKGFGTGPLILISAELGQALREALVNGGLIKGAAD